MSNVEKYLVVVLGFLSIIFYSCSQDAKSIFERYSNIVLPKKYEIISFFNYSNERGVLKYVEINFDDDEIQNLIAMACKNNYKKLPINEQLGALTLEGEDVLNYLHPKFSKQYEPNLIYNYCQGYYKLKITNSTCFEIIILDSTNNKVLFYMIDE